MDERRRQHLQNLLDIHVRRAELLLVQIARRGPDHVEVHRIQELLDDVEHAEQLATELQSPVPEVARRSRDLLPEARWREPRAEKEYRPAPPNSAPPPPGTPEELPASVDSDNLVGAAPRVLLSYAHFSEAHRTAVLELAQRLRRDGVNARLDRFEPHQTDWPLWVAREIDAADKIVCICSAEWRLRYEAAPTPGTDTGVRDEGRLIRSRISEARGAPHGVAAVALGRESYDQHVPRDLRSGTRYLLPNEYERLYAWLTDRTLVEPAPLGAIRPLDATRDRLTPQPALPVLSAGASPSDNTTPPIHSSVVTGAGATIEGPTTAGHDIVGVAAPPSPPAPSARGVLGVAVAVAVLILVALAAATAVALWWTVDVTATT